MTNRYYAPGANRAAKVDDLFATIARRYDLINDLQSLGLHRRWKRRMVALAQPAPGEAALDLCCGTGDIAFELARRGAQVTGLDFNEAMLGIASSRREAATQRGSVRFLCGDAQHVPFPPGQFDIVTVGYGLRNLTDWRIGLEEMHRVAKPGGRLLVLDFGKPANPSWRVLYFAYLRWCAPMFGRALCGDAQTYGYILESLRHYPAQLGVEEYMRKLDCEGTRIINLLGGAMSINIGRKKVDPALL
jgi:demethylmenaquinone methyltransferase / 2-methoxy-6-polyprenyl-1,4-benzoquinol methylase